MRRLEAAYSGQVVFRYIDYDNMSREDRKLAWMFFAGSLPSFGFFDEYGNLVDSMAGWDQWEFESRLEALASGWY